MNLKIIFLLTFLCSTFSSWASDPYWYGTISFKKDFKSEETTTYVKGDTFYPGNKVDTTIKTWSGEIRYLPNKKAIISARYTDKTTSDRKTQGARPCPWKDGMFDFRDFEIREHTTKYTTNREISDDLWIRIKDDGSYKIRKSATSGKHIDNATIYHQRRERFDACDPNPQKIEEEYSSSSNGMDGLDFDNIAGTADPSADKLTGKWSGKDIDGGDLSYSWDLTRIAPELIAKINAPSTIERTKVITLDASLSQGNIKDYTWVFTPNGDCLMSPKGTELKLKGQKVSFIALCDFTAHLDVEDEDDIDFARHTVIVTPRDPNKWKTSFTTKAGPNFTKRINSWELPLGSNPCSLHNDVANSSHAIHTDSINSKTWLDSAYKMAKVEDDGPFQDTWYIESQNLKIDRSERLNTNILPGGEIYKINVDHNNLKDMLDLINQTKKHEQLHSLLIEEELKRLGPDGDAAQKIEKLTGPEADLLQFMADREIREANTFLMAATQETKVQDRLKALGFLRNIGIWIYTADDDSDPTNNPTMLRNMGPLWSIGD